MISPSLVLLLLLLLLGVLLLSEEFAASLLLVRVDLLVGVDCASGGEFNEPPEPPEFDCELDCAICLNKEIISLLREKKFAQENCR